MTGLQQAGRQGGGSRRSLFKQALAFLVAGFMAVTAAQGHLIVDQKGTLNFVDDGAFLVISLPVTAFEGSDDDGDGRLSFAEMARHTAAIQRQIRDRIRLSDASGAKPLEELLLNLSVPDDAPSAPATHLVAMGRFALGSSAGQIKQGPFEATHFEASRFEASLFGRTEAEQTLTVTLKRGQQTQLLLLSPEHPSGRVFPPTWQVFVDFVLLGAEHVLSGLDHLLFLLVVLAAGWTTRQLITVLTGFTLGHALTLTASILGGLSLSPALVEPAIAATIVTMGLIDVWDKRQTHRIPVSLRIGLVFVCSLIHGLGLAGALGSLGLTQENRILSLVGFNLGIELGQLVFALGAGLVALLIRRIAGTRGLAFSGRAASVGAILAGIVWFGQRIS
jgi:hypothetical protein